MTRIDVHQHLWTAPLVDALAARRDLPFARRENGLTVLFTAHERPYVIDSSAASEDARVALLADDGVEEAWVCLSTPVGIESLPREEALPILDAYHAGALALSHRFRVWGAIAVDEPDAGDADELLDCGCVGVSIPAGALSSAQALASLRDVLACLEFRDAPLLVHPGPGRRRDGAGREQSSLGDPLWWPALTTYVSQLQAAWLAFACGGRAEHPRLRVVFSALAGLAPLHFERLRARGGRHEVSDELLFYETSSYGPVATGALAEVVGPRQLLYGSDRPVAEPVRGDIRDELGWRAIAENTTRALTGEGAHRVRDLVPQRA
jgi:6-methylsalicylate decarboxylase